MDLWLITSALSLAGNRKNSKFAAVSAKHLNGVFSKTRLVLTLLHLVHMKLLGLFILTGIEIFSLSYFFVHVFLGAVEHMQKEWSCLAKSIRSESQDHQLPASATRYCSCFLCVQYSARIILCLFGYFCL